MRSNSSQKVAIRHKNKFILILIAILTLVISVAVARTVLATGGGPIFYGKIGSVIAICTVNAPPPAPPNPCIPYAGLQLPYVVVATVDGIPNIVAIIPATSLGNTQIPAPGNWLVGFGTQTPTVFIAGTYWMVQI
ncbi:MAG: hypothetical protein NTX82_03080 [Candidatus Parcubacteria bacterium]|nr:hypothetical protein [Candidatus Parcubacteria bacterium]